MANFENFSFTKIWILAKYSKLISNSISNSNDASWKNYNSSDLGSPLTISLTPTNHLTIKHDSDIFEFINLYNARDYLIGTYSGDSMLISHKMNNCLRKFRFRFLEQNLKSARENCLDFVNQISRFFACEEINKQSQDTSRLCSSSSSLPNSLSISYNPPSNEQKKSFSENSNINESVSLKEMAKILIEKNSKRLPLFYQKVDESEFDSSLEELIISCLLDSNFPQFVEKVETTFTNLLTSELFENENEN